MENFFGKIYSFDKFQLDPDERLLFDGVKTIPLAPKVFDTLLLLIENAGHVLSKERMLEEIWEGSFVEENNLAQNISFLRRILGETKDFKFIETVPKYGYRFIVPVQLVEDNMETVTFERTQARILIREVIEEEEGEKRRWGEREKGREGEGEIWETDIFSPSPHLPVSPSPLLPAAVPETHYVENGDVNIAYQTVGEGDLDIVFVMGWVSHLEYFWKHPLFEIGRAHV